MLIGYCPMPIHTSFFSWQLVQPLLTPAWIMPVVGTGVWNAVPGATLLAEALTRLDGVLPKWQLSQAAAVGKCEPAPGVVLGGITTMALMPAKLLAVMLAP